MFKFLFIVTFVAYVLYKIGSFFFRAGAASQQFRQPPPPKRATGKKGTLRGGEYVDYEEVK
jgi:hypothetical protein